MKLLLVHNEYGRESGEEVIFHGTAELLRSRGHEVRTFVRSSKSLHAGIQGKIRGFFSGIWSMRARREFAVACDEFQPELVHLQNLFPLISPSIIGVVRSRSIPLVLACHNYRLFCPTGLMQRNGSVCTKCATGGEWHCVRHNCEGQVARSIGYAVRNRVARSRLLQSVHQFVVLSSFQAERFAEWGLPRERLSIVPNFIDSARFPVSTVVPGSGDCLAFVGRLSAEKGIGVLVEAARRLPRIRFELAGHAARMPETGPHPDNLVLRGEIPWAELPAFYRRARFLVVPSVWFEGFPLVVLEAMLQERAVVASRIGGLTDIVVDGVTGVHFSPGDVGALAEGLQALWDNPLKSEELGRQGRERVLAEYSADRSYASLMEAYGRARALAAAR